MSSAKRAQTAFSTGGLSEIVPKSLTGKSAAKRAGKEQRALMAQQRQTEKLRAAETQSEIDRRIALKRPGAAGRSLLIGTSETGTAGETLG